MQFYEIVQGDMSWRDCIELSGLKTDVGAFVCRSSPSHCVCSVFDSFALWLVVCVCVRVFAGKSWCAQISRIEFIVVENEGVGTCYMHAFHAQMLRCQLKNPSKKVKRNVCFFSSLQPNATRSRSSRPFHQIIIYYRSSLHGIAHRILGNVCVAVCSCTIGTHATHAIDYL